MNSYERTKAKEMSERMKTNIAVILSFLFLFIIFTGCGIILAGEYKETSASASVKLATALPAPGANAEKPAQASSIPSKPIKDPQEKMIDVLFKDLYIGEAYQSGFLYLEPFKADRGVGYEKITFEDYSDEINFYTINGRDNVYNANFDGESDAYIPSAEDGGLYYWQGARGEDAQYTLRYKTDSEVKEPYVGGAFMSHEIDGVDFSDMGKLRPYTEEEYTKAYLELKEDNIEKEASGSAFRDRTIDESIIGAVQLCLIRVKNTDVKIRLSKYFYYDTDNTADVYVVDFINDYGIVVKTYEKHNWATY
jgi:hypothetical protein